MAERRRPSKRTIPRALQATHDHQQQLQRWVQRIKRARKLRQDWSQKYRVDILAQTFNGDLGTSMDALDTDELVVIINRFWPTVKAQMPGLLYQNPTFFVRPKGRGASQVKLQEAMAGESLLKDIAGQDDHFVQEAKLALQQSFWGIGVLKSIYDPKLEPNPQRGEPMYLLTPQGEPMRDTLTGEPMPLVDPRTGQPMTEPAKAVTDELYRWRWIHWSNMLLPDEGPAMLTWSWVGEEVEVPLEEAKDDDRFPKALRDQLVATRKPLAEGADPNLAKLYDVHELDQKLWYVECWDIVNKRHYIVAEGQPFSSTQFLLDDAYPEGVEDHPYAILPGYTPLTDPEPSPWPVPHVWNWLALQEEYSQRRKQMMNAARRSARKYYYDNNTFPDQDEATSALSSNKDMEGVLVNDVMRPPVVLADPGSPPDIARDLALLEKDWLNATGTPGERMGNPSSDTATQALLSDRSATLREGEMKNSVQLWLTTAGKKMLQLLKATLTLERWVQIRDFTDADLQQWLVQRFGPQGAALMQMPGAKQALIARYGNEKWQRVTRESLQFEADVGVVPGSARARTMEQDRQQALLFMRTLAEIGSVMPGILMSRRFVSHMGELFELGDDLLIDEIIASVKQQMQMMAQAQQMKAAGGARGGMGQAPSPAQVEGQPMIASRLQTALLNGGF